MFPLFCVLEIFPCLSHSDSRLTHTQLILSPEKILPFLGGMETITEATIGLLYQLWLQSKRSGFDSRRYKIFCEVVGLDRGPLSLVSTIEDLL
jgi:hypothetical protein